MQKLVRSISFLLVIALIGPLVAGCSLNSQPVFTLKLNPLPPPDPLLPYIRQDAR